MSSIVNQETKQPFIFGDSSTLVSAPFESWLFIAVLRKIRAQLAIGLSDRHHSIPIFHKIRSTVLGHSDGVVPSWSENPCLYPILFFEITSYCTCKGNFKYSSEVRAVGTSDNVQYMYISLGRPCPIFLQVTLHYYYTAKVKVSLHSFIR